MADDGDNLSERNEKSSRNNIKKIWTADQDEKLKDLVAQHGMSWTKIGELFRERNGKQCRERWYNHLDPAVNKGEWTLEEDDVLFSLQREIGNHWAKITKALPGRTDNAIKNRFNAACRNHALLLAAAATAGLPAKEISLYDALHMHDTKLSTSEKTTLLPLIIPVQESTVDRPLSAHQTETCQTRTNTSFHSPLGTRSLSPSEFNESSKHQRVDVNAQQQLIQQQYMQQQLYKQQQLQQDHHLQQLVQQQQQQQLQQQQQQRQQQLQQHQQQQRQLQELQHQRSQQYLIRQRALSMQTLPSHATICDQIPRTNSLGRLPLSHNTAQHDKHTVQGDMDMQITPELFDRIALTNIPRPNPASSLNYKTTIKTEILSGVDISQRRNLSLSNLIANQLNDHNKGKAMYVNEAAVVHNINSSSIVGQSIGSNFQDSYFQNANNGSSLNNNNNNDNNNNNKAPFIDFDESIFEDWISDDTELDFMEPIENSNRPPSIYDMISNGCASSQAFCTGTSMNNGLSDYPIHQGNTYVQNTTNICCGYPSISTDSSSIFYQQKQMPLKQPFMFQQVPHLQQHSHHATNKPQKIKPLGFGSSIRALKGRFCGSGHIDSSFKPSVDYIYDPKTYLGGQQSVMKDDMYRTQSSFAGSSVLISKYGQNALREQYANSRNHSGMTAGTSYSVCTSQDDQMRNAYGSYLIPPFPQGTPTIPAIIQNPYRSSIDPPPEIFMRSNPGRDEMQQGIGRS